MKKSFTTLVIASFAFSPLARADVGSDVATEQTTTIPAEVPTLPPNQEVVSPQEPYGDLAETWEEEEDENPQGTEVTTTTNETEKTKRRIFWRNIIIATVAVIVAVVSIIVVSNDNGKSP